MAIGWSGGGRWKIKKKITKSRKLILVLINSFNNDQELSKERMLGGATNVDCRFWPFWAVLHIQFSNQIEDLNIVYFPSPIVDCRLGIGCRVQICRQDIFYLVNSC